MSRNEAYEPYQPYEPYEPDESHEAYQPYEPQEPGPFIHPSPAFQVQAAPEPGPRLITPEALAGLPDKPPKPARTWLNFHSVSELIDYEPPRDFMLMGDCHLTRGNITILSGWPGVGKSRAALALAIAGARGVDWLGHRVHCRFRSLIVQCENGPMRLRQELREAIPQGGLDDWLRITPPPPHGLAFDEPAFRAELAREIEEFKPGLLVIDPWNRVAAGDKQTDYRQALGDIGACLPEKMEETPAILIVHHMRKKGGEGSTRKRGRDLLHELAGSYQIGSSARCVFALEPASNDTTDDQVILTCCKNNDGKLGAPSAWRRRNGLFDPAPDFDMEAFLTAPAEDAKAKRPGIPYETIAKALRAMRCRSRTQVAMRLVNAGICERTKAFEILKEYIDREHVVEDTDGNFYWAEDPSELG
jgi:hypothetical protein